jgi:hypothetical protein
MSERGIAIHLELVKVAKHAEIQGSGPIIKEIARISYEMGADYMYRVNDDTEFYGRWPGMFVDTLTSASSGGASTRRQLAAALPFGVVGPSAFSAPNAKILTNDFVHRTHMDIFHMNYFPDDVVANEYLMNMWMSAVYGYKRTFKTTETKVSGGINQFVSDAKESVLRTIAASQREVREWLDARGLSNDMYGDPIEEGKPSLDPNVLQLTSKLALFPNLVVECDVNAGTLSQRAQYCADTRQKHSVIPRKSKGSLSKAQLITWKANKCGSMFHKLYDYAPAALAAKKSHKTRKQGTFPTTFHKLPVPDCLEHNNSTVDSSLTPPLIAILSGSTSRKEPNPSNKTLSVFTIMLPSLLRSLDCGFRYVVVIGYDKGDKFYDSDKVRIDSCLCVHMFYLISCDINRRVKLKPSHGFINICMST